MSLHRITYSSATGELTSQELIEIMAASELNNRRDEIGGILLYYPATPCQDGAFIQVLEGERSRIEEAYGRIAMDPRHAQLVLTSSAAVADRLFADWGMGLGNLTDDHMQRVLPVVTQAGQRAPTMPELLASPAIAEALLQLWLSEQNLAADPLRAG